MTEMIELTNNEYVTINYQSWETDTNKTGKRTNYEQLIYLTVPKKYKDLLMVYLEKDKKYNVDIYQTIWNKEQIGTVRYTITLKTSSEKRKETLTNKLSNDLFSFFENERVLLEA